MPANWDPFVAFEGEQGSVDKNGIETVQVSFYVPSRVMARFWVPPGLVAEIGLPIYGPRQWQQEWGNGRLIQMGRDGAFKTTITLQGMEEPKDGENGVQFDADGADAEEDAESHPGLQYLMDHYDGTIEDNKLVFQPTLTVKGAEVKNPLFGFKKWYVPGLTWTKTYATIRPHPSVTLRLGKVDVPPKASDGYLPDLPGRRNWLKVAGKPSWRGNVWKVTESWLMSADGGWNEDVYR